MKLRTLPAVQDTAVPTPLPRMSVQSVSKHFGAVRALVDVDLAVARGSVHALVGGNGAGKTTLAGVISGRLRPDAGQVMVNGRPVHFRNPRDASADKIALIAQDFAVVPTMTAIDNIFLGVEKRRLGLVDRSAQRRRLAEVEDLLGYHVPWRARGAELTAAERQKVAILRALVREADLIVMDEPTAALDSAEASQLLCVIRSLSAAGTTVVFVSHALDQVLDVADTVTIMKGGRVVATRPAHRQTLSGLIDDMLAPTARPRASREALASTGGAVALSVRGLTRRPAFANVSFDIRSGEIVGLTGLVGSGCSELVRALAGAVRAESGAVNARDVPVRLGHPRDALRAGIMLLPDDRDLDGLVPNASVKDNVTLASLPRISTMGFIRSRRERGMAATICDGSGIAAPISRPVAQLSGGNKQKVLLARALLTEPAVLLADEPFRGMDLGARSAAHDRMRSLARGGAAILLVSNDADELGELACRTLVMREGRLVGESRSTLQALAVARGEVDTR